MIYADTIWVLYDACIDIGELRTFLVVHREVFVDSYKKVIEYVDTGLGTQEAICGASNYQNVLGGGCLKGLKSMVYGMLEES